MLHAKQWSDTQPLSRYCQTPYPRQAILLGYAAHTPDELRENIKKLAQVL
ncbi:hypothetical protein [Shewanella baltica]